MCVYNIRSLVEVQYIYIYIVFRFPSAPVARVYISQRKFPYTTDTRSRCQFVVCVFAFDKYVAYFTVRRLICGSSSYEIANTVILNRV